MYKKLQVAALILLTFFQSCKDDENDSPPASEMIIGKWEVLSAEYYDCPDPADDETIQCPGSGVCGTLIFSADGNFVETKANTYFDTYRFEGAYLLRTYYNAELRYTVTFSGETMTTVFDVGSNECKTKTVYKRVPL